MIRRVVGSSLVPVAGMFLRHLLRGSGRDAKRARLGQIVAPHPLPVVAELRQGPDILLEDVAVFRLQRLVPQQVIVKPAALVVEAEPGKVGGPARSDVIGIRPAFDVHGPREGFQGLFPLPLLIKDGGDVHAHVRSIEIGKFAIHELFEQFDGLVAIAGFGEVGGAASERCIQGIVQGDKTPLRGLTLE